VERQSSTEETKHFGGLGNNAPFFRNLGEKGPEEKRKDSTMENVAGNYPTLRILQSSGHWEKGLNEVPWLKGKKSEVLLKAGKKNDSSSRG